MDDQCTKNHSCHLRSVSSLVCLHNLQSSYNKPSRSSYFFQVSLSSPSSPDNCARTAHSSLQSENITYRPHVAHSCVNIRNTYNRYIIYENCTVRLASVGLAQARPNYPSMHVAFYCSPGSPQDALHLH